MSEPRQRPELTRRPTTAATATGLWIAAAAAVALLGVGVAVVGRAGPGDGGAAAERAGGSGAPRRGEPRPVVVVAAPVGAPISADGGAAAVTGASPIVERSAALRPLPPYGAAAAIVPGGPADTAPIRAARVAGDSLPPEILGALQRALPAEAVARIRQEGVARYEPNAREPMIPFGRLPRPTTDCSILARLPGTAILRISEAGRILGARLLSDPTAPLPAELYACEFGPIANDGSHAVFQTVTPPPATALPLEAGPAATGGGSTAPSGPS